MSEAFPSVPERAAQEQFSQVEKYQELAQKLGVTEADKEGARFNGSFTLQPGDTLSKKLLEHYGVNADGRRKMASMLVQMAQAGFNVDFVKAGETLNFKGNEVEVVKHNGEKIVLNLDGGSAEIKDESRRAIEGVTRDVAAGLALEIYNLYLTAQAGGDVGNWEEQKGDFIEAVVKIIEFAASATPEQGEKLNFVEGQFAKIAEAEAAHGKGSAEYNIAIINLIKEFKGQMNEEQMAEFWDWVTQYVKEKKQPTPAPEPEAPKEVIDAERVRAFQEAAGDIEEYLEKKCRYKDVGTILVPRSNTEALLTVNFEFKKEKDHHDYALRFDEGQKKVVVSSTDTDLRRPVSVKKLQKVIDRDEE